MAKKKGGGEEASPGISVIARNKQAFHNYEVLQKLECGLVLTGTEVKSLRAGHVAFADSFATVKDGEAYLLNLNISEYSMGNRFNHITTRRRKLLIHRREARKLRSATEQRGLTLVPLSLYWRRGLAKVELGLVRGKQLHDKRDAIRNREQARDKQRVMRQYSKG